MVVLIALLVALAVMALVMLAAQAMPVTPEAVRRLQELPLDSGMRSAAEKRRRQERSERLQGILEALGTRVEEGRDTSSARRLLITAGYTSQSAVPLFFGTRVALAGALGIGSMALAPFLGLPLAWGAFAAAWGMLVGYLVPVFVLGSRGRRRQKEMVKALPDALDLMVVCVEAGLALNQTLVRVAEEIANISPVLGEQMGLVNLEIRAGTPRDEALKNFAERTNVEDIRALVTMLIQTERFGTSIAHALRIHADTLRTKRRQRAEEESAKTAIKMLFPLVFFIFPAMFVVILGPAMIQIADALGNV